MEIEVTKWFFSKEELDNTPSRKQGIDSARELSFRQQAANFVQDMGQRLQLSQLCINTAIIYMHRFYVFHSFMEIHRNKLSIAGLFLAAKVEEQPRKIEHVIKVAHACLHKENPQLDVKSEEYTNKLNEAVAYENILLQTLGFDIGIEHPHTYVVKVCQLVKASKDLAQTSYIMATTSLHMTTMCLQYKPTVVACVCIHLACKWSSYMIEKCSEGRDWFYYVDKDVTWELLERLTQEFIEILERSPHRFKRKFGKDGTMHARPVDNNPSLPGPSGSGTSTPNNHRPLAVPVDTKTGIVKKEPSSPESSHVLALEYCSDVKEKKPVIKKEPVSPKKEEKPQLPVLPPQPSTSSQPQLPPHPALKTPVEDMDVCDQSSETPQEKSQPPPPLPQQLPPPPPAVYASNEHSSNKRSSSKESMESSSSKRHKSKHSSKNKVSSSNSFSSNHSEPNTGIKVKIRKDIISLKSVDCGQKYNPAIKAESPKKPLKIKLPRPPPEMQAHKHEAAPVPPPLRIVLTKDKSGSGSYSTSHKSEHRESRKRSHSNVAADGSQRDHKNSVDPSKYSKIEQHQKNHSGDQRPNKMSRHSSHRSDADTTRHNASSSRLQYPAVSDKSTFQNYAAAPNYQNSYQMLPPPPLPKLKGHNMMVGKTNFPMPPPLPPPQPPPPPPPPEDI